MGLGSEIRDLEKTYSGSIRQGQKGSVSRIRIRNTASRVLVYNTDSNPGLFCEFVTVLGNFLTQFFLLLSLFLST